MVITVLLLIAVVGLLVVRNQLNKSQEEYRSLQETKTKIEQELKTETSKSGELELKLQKTNEELEKLKQAKAEAKAKLALASVAHAAPVTVSTEAEAKQWIIAHEGGLTSVNKTTYACGKPQANDCDKLLDFAGVYHAKNVKPWNYTYAEAVALVSQVPESVQDAWMDKYVAGRYTTYMNAYRYWLANGNY